MRAVVMDSSISTGTISSAERSGAWSARRRGRLEHQGSRAGGGVEIEVPVRRAFGRPRGGVAPFEVAVAGPHDQPYRRVGGRGGVVLEVAVEERELLGQAVAVHELPIVG